MVARLKAQISNFDSGMNAPFSNRVSEVDTIDLDSEDPFECKSNSTISKNYRGKLRSSQIASRGV